MSAQVTITQLPTAGAITGTELVPVVQNGVTVQTTTAALAGSPVQTYSYLTVTQTPQLANSRYVGVTNGLTITDGGSQGLFNISTTGALLSLVNSGTGFQVKTSATAITPRSIAVSGTGLSITNGSGVSGDPTISLTGQISNFANASFNGLVVLSTAGAITSATITGTSSQIAVTNGNGISGNPTVGLADNPVLPGTGSVTVPVGTTGQQPFGSAGMIRYDSTVGAFLGYSGTGWNQFSLAGGVTQVNTGTGLAGGPITGIGTISIANTAVTAGSYTLANFTVNAQGQITAASSGTALVSSFTAGSTGFTPNTTTTGAVTLGGILNASNGGTGAATLTGYVYGNGTGVMTASTTIPNAGLANSSVTYNGVAVALGASGTITAANPNALTIGTGLSGTSYTGAAAVTIAIDSTVATLTGTQTLTNKTISGASNTFSSIPNSALTNNTISGVALGGNLFNLTAGTGVSFSAGTTYNGSAAITINATGLGGTVTSVAQSFTGGLIFVAGSPITSSGTLALTVAGTSGGIPYFSSGTTWATSAALAASALMVGGGVGAAPSTITTGTGVVTALGVNTGSAGAFVVNGGALGTPSSGTVTNLTGTASININGTVGATTPTTGNFTTVTATTGIFGGTF